VQAPTGDTWFLAQEHRGLFGWRWTRAPLFAGLRLADWAFIAYMVGTGLYRLAFAAQIPSGELVASLVGRIAAIVGIVFVVHRAGTRPTPLWRFLRDGYIPPLMGWLYMETASHNLFLLGDHVGHHLARWDEAIFGIQASVEFFEAFPQAWLGELLSFCYFSYYLMFFGTLWWFWFRRDRGHQVAYQRYLFLLAFVMVPCYVCYSLVAWWGPQYVFHEVYSREKFTGYAFKHALDFVLERGERPTGAMPSSHTALSAAFLVFMWRVSRPWAAAILPVFAGLWVSTVYIQAHYIIDVVVGLPLGLAMGWLAPRVQDWIGDPGLSPGVVDPPGDASTFLRTPLWGWRGER
jgi:membrane-associated phospholipid phosphatase